MHVPDMLCAAKALTCSCMSNCSSGAWICAPEESSTEAQVMMESAAAPALLLLRLASCPLPKNENLLG
jgi:hypothetical protein